MITVHSKVMFHSGPLTGSHGVVIEAVRNRKMFDCKVQLTTVVMSDPAMQMAGLYKTGDWVFANSKELIQE